MFSLNLKLAPDIFKHNILQRLLNHDKFKDPELISKFLRLILEEAWNCVSKSYSYVTDWQIKHNLTNIKRFLDGEVNYDLYDMTLSQSPCYYLTCCAKIVMGAKEPIVDHAIQHALNACARTFLFSEKKVLGKFIRYAKFLLSESTIHPEQLQACARLMQSLLDEKMNRKEALIFLKDFAFDNGIEEQVKQLIRWCGQLDRRWLFISTDLEPFASFLIKHRKEFLVYFKGIL